MVRPFTKKNFLGKGGSPTKHKMAEKVDSS